MSENSKFDHFQAICKSLKLDIPEKEYKFHCSRKWRIDYCWVDLRLAVELEGGVYSRGRHVRGPGYEKDLEKYNAIQEQNYILLRYLPTKIDWQQIERVYTVQKLLSLKLPKL